MKTKEVIILLLAAIQPIIWWGVYNLLQPIAKVSDSEVGLGFSCLITAVILMIGLTIAATNKYIKG
jgi:cell division protein FtsX